VNRPPAPRGRLGLALGVILVLATGGAAAEGRSLLFWAPYAPGSAEQAAGTMDAFARYLETAAGWPTGTMSAAYDNSVEGGRGAVEAGRPGFVVVPTPVYLNHAARFQWAPIKFLVTEDADAQRYSLYGPPVRPAGLDARIARRRHARRRRRLRRAVRSRVHPGPRSRQARH